MPTQVGLDILRKFHCYNLFTFHKLKCILPYILLSKCITVLTWNILHFLIKRLIGSPYGRDIYGLSKYLLSLFALLKRSLGRTEMPVVRPSVLLSVCPSVRPTCERDMLRTVSPIDFKFEI